MQFKKIKGTRDYFLEEQEVLSFVKKRIENVVETFNFSKITFPVIENADLFKRSVGEVTDIVNKEMYSFLDKSNNQIVLRPEGTSSVVRMVVENKLINLNQKRNFYYFDKMFRYERPQKGRQREFFQFGVESFNDGSVEKDLQILLLAIKILNSLGINKYQLEINSIGGNESRERYKEEFKKYLSKQFEKLSSESKIRFEKNPLRILDSKDEGDKELLIGAPNIFEFLSDDEKQRFILLRKYLDDVGVPYIVNKNLVRGLDYYNDLVFEIVSKDNKLGSNSTILAGGRYDNLIGTFESKLNVPAIGFAIGIERIILSLNDGFIKSNLLKRKKIVITSFSSEYVGDALSFFNDLKENENLDYKLNLEKQNISKKIVNAVKNDYDFVIIIDKEFKNNILNLKNIKTDEQIKVNKDELMSFI